MKNSLDVKNIVKNIEDKSKPSFLNNFFKKIIIKKFSNINKGYIKLKDKDNVLELGDSKSEIKCDIKINSSEF